ncbi:MAG: rod shape-determining protein MreC [Burkholderiaceae bacterium]
MPLGTLDRRPPPFFHQGPSALTRLAVFSAVALFLMAADTRFAVTRPLRSGLQIVLLPLERVLAVPQQLTHTGGEYMSGLHAAQAEVSRAELALTAQSAKAARVDTLIAENTRLRALVDLKPALAVRAQAAEVLYEASDPFSRKIFIDHGATQGVVPGAPVIDEAGVLGQVTRVYPLSSEVTLLIDKEAAIPVLNTRTHQRSAAFGADGAAMELRFMAGNADVHVGDLLQTSGVDGIYPPGLDVARVVKVDPRADSSFARIALVPTASADGVRHVLVLEPMALQLPARPAPEPDTSKDKKTIKGTKK